MTEAQAQAKAGNETESLQERVEALLAEVEAAQARAVEMLGDAAENDAVSDIEQQMIDSIGPGAAAAAAQEPASPPHVDPSGPLVEAEGEESSSEAPDAPEAVDAEPSGEDPVDAAIDEAADEVVPAEPVEAADVASDDAEDQAGAPGVSPPEDTAAEPEPSGPGTADDAEAEAESGGSGGTVGDDDDLAAMIEAAISTAGMVAETAAEPQKSAPAPDPEPESEPEPQSIDELDSALAAGAEDAIESDAEDLAEPAPAASAPEPSEPEASAEPESAPEPEDAAEVDTPEPSVAEPVSEPDPEPAADPPAVSEDATPAPQAEAPVAQDEPVDTTEASSGDDDDDAWVEPPSLVDRIRSLAAALASGARPIVRAGGGRALGLLLRRVEPLLTRLSSGYRAQPDNVRKVITLASVWTAGLAAVVWAKAAMFTTPEMPPAVSDPVKLLRSQQDVRDEIGGGPR